MVNLVRNLWQTSKVLVLSLLVYVCSVCILLANTFICYLSMREVKGNITNVSLEKGKKTILKLNIADDRNIYYQKYERRFSDKNVSQVISRQPVHFYTLANAQKKRPAISTLGDQSEFYYYPIFYINQTPGMVQVFLYQFYSSLIVGILILLSWVLILYNGFSVIMKSGIAIKVLFGLLMIGMIWLVI